MKKLVWITNETLDCSPTEKNERIKLEIECVRYYPMPSNNYSVKELEDRGFYGLYMVVENV